MTKENRAELYGKMLAGEVPGISVFPAERLNTDTSRCSRIVENLQAYDTDRSGVEKIAEGKLNPELGKYSQINIELRREDNLKNGQMPIARNHGMEM